MVMVNSNDCKQPSDTRGSFLLSHQVAVNSVYKAIMHERLTCSSPEIENKIGFNKQRSANDPHISSRVKPPDSGNSLWCNMITVMKFRP